MSVLCKFMSDPSRDCHDAAMGVLLYVYKTRERRIRYTIWSKTPACLHQFNREINGNYGFHSFSDSSWGVPNPVFGYCLWLSNGPISWCAKTCKSADSSCEAEYTAASKALRDVKFVRYLCEDMGRAVGHSSWPIFALGAPKIVGPGFAQIELRLAYIHIHPTSSRQPRARDPIPRHTRAL